VIFVHSCFWHAHACKPGLIPNSNRDFWLPKLRKNKARDRKNLKALTQLGWDALVIWQCELKNLSRLETKLAKFIAGYPIS
jgi:DNA mismatch endonuclease (patch repair protein)